MTVKTKTTLSRVATVLVCVIMLIAFLLSGIRIFGFQVYGVLSGSMEPALPVGSLIYVKKVDSNELNVRDIITFRISGTTIATHRIVEIVPDENNPYSRQFRTQGDANASPDANLVSAGNIVGKVQFCIPKLGNLANFIKSPGGTVVTIIVSLMLICFVFYTDKLDDEGKFSKRKQKKSFSNIVRGHAKKTGSRTNPTRQQYREHRQEADPHGANRTRMRDPYNRDSYRRDQRDRDYQGEVHRRAPYRSNSGNPGAYSREYRKDDYYDRRSVSQRGYSRQDDSYGYDRQRLPQRGYDRQDDSYGYDRQRPPQRGCDRKDDYYDRRNMPQRGYSRQDDSYVSGRDYSQPQSAYRNSRFGSVQTESERYRGRQRDQD